MFKIYLASTNSHKAREMGEFLEGVAEVLIHPEYKAPHEDGDSFRENAIIKAKALSRLIPKELVLGEDSGLVVPFLGGAPGVKSHRFSTRGTDLSNIEKLLSALKPASGQERKAYFVSYGVLMRGGKILWEGEGRVEGEITHKPMGEEGFGYDPVFFYPPMKRTFAQLTREEKNRVSHRGRMLSMLKEFLLKNGG